MVPVGIQQRAVRLVVTGLAATQWFLQVRDAHPAALPKREEFALGTAKLRQRLCSTDLQKILGDSAPASHADGIRHAVLERGVVQDRAYPAMVRVDCAQGAFQAVLEI